LIASGVPAHIPPAVNLPPPIDKARSSSSLSKPIASPSTLQELGFNCKHYSKSFLRTVVRVPFAISWPDFLKRLRDEFPGVCGCTYVPQALPAVLFCNNWNRYVHDDHVAVISNFRQFEQACERVEDAFIAGKSDGSLDILVRERSCCFRARVGADYPQVIDDAAALASIVGSITKQAAAAADSAPSSHRPQSGTRGGCCGSCIMLHSSIFFCRHASSSHIHSSSKLSPRISFKPPAVCNIAGVQRHAAFRVCGAKCCEAGSEERIAAVECAHCGFRCGEDI
jgi:hypothetical protein